MKVFLASDHAGFRLKEWLKDRLNRWGHDVVDLGAKRFSSRDDYPRYALNAARKVSRVPESRAILICGSGVGMEIVANKVRGVRAVNVWSTAIAKKSRQHEDTNILCLSSWFLARSDVEAIVRTWLKTSFSRARRHQRRVRQISRFDRR